MLTKYLGCESNCDENGEPRMSENDWTTKRAVCNLYERTFTKNDTNVQQRLNVDGKAQINIFEKRNKCSIDT